MKTRRISLIIKLWLALILVSVPIPCVGSADSAASLDEQILKAAENSDSAAVKTLLKKGVNVNFRDKEGHTLLMYGIKGGNPKIVKLLLENGADVNAIGAGATPLTAVCFGFTARRGKQELTRLFLKL